MVVQNYINDITIFEFFFFKQQVKTYKKSNGNDEIAEYDEIITSLLKK